VIDFEYDRLKREGWEAFARNELGAAEACYQQCLSRLPASAGEERRSTEYMLGFVYAQSGRHAQARKIYNRLLQWQRERGVPTAPGGEWSQAVMLHQLAMVERLAGRVGEVRGYLEEERELRQDADWLGLSANSYELGELALMEKNNSAAEDLMCRSLEEARKSGDAVCVACALRGLGTVLAARRECADEAETCLQQSVSEFLRAGDELGATEVRQLLKEL
jgi:tetratricopeptide (TPR) repeat protein